MTSEERLLKALEVAKYIESKAKPLDDFGDFVAVPSQAWSELMSHLETKSSIVLNVNKAVHE